jgi:hypothetical protein
VIREQNHVNEFPSQRRCMPRRVLEFFNVNNRRYQDNKAKRRRGEDGEEMWTSIIDELAYESNVVKDELEPIRDLAMSILTRALDDLIAWVEVQRGAMKQSEVYPPVVIDDPVEAARFDEVLGWFLEEDDEPQYPFSVCRDITSFHGVCGILDVDPDALLEQVFRRLRAKGMLHVVS